jgi:hypothetical protein
VPTHVAQYPTVPTLVALAPTVPTHVAQYQTVPTHVAQYQTVPTHVAQYQTVPTHVAQYQTVLTGTAHYQNSWRPPSIAPSLLHFTHSTVSLASFRPLQAADTLLVAVWEPHSYLSRPADTQWTLLPRVSVCM